MNGRQHTEKSRFFLSLCFALWALTLFAHDGSALSLRLDERLSTAKGGEGAAVPLVYESQAVSDRLRRLRGEIRLREKEHAALSRHLAAREKHIVSLQRVIEAHNEAMAAVSLVGAADRPAAAPVKLVTRTVTPRQIPADTADWIEDLLLQVGGLFAAALVLSLFLFLRSHNRVRRLSAVDSEIRSIMRKRGEAGSDAAVAKVVTHSVQLESVGTEDAKETKKESRRRHEVPAGAAKHTEQLREVDAKIAFEDYSGAAELLKQLAKEYPQSPEVRLRLLHVQTANGDEAAARAEERALSVMMEGPSSNTQCRVRQAGKQMMPGHPLFSDEPRRLPENSDRIEGKTA